MSPAHRDSGEVILQRIHLADHAGDEETAALLLRVLMAIILFNTDRESNDE